MKRIFVFLAAISVIIFSVSTVFGEPNPSSTQTPNAAGRIAIQEPKRPNPEATPEIVKQRLEELNTSVEMTYSPSVQTHIDRYLKNGRAQLKELIARSEYYLPIFEQALMEAGLPDELKYLPVIESHLEVKATSPRGAGGLWQFMPITAKGLDMKVNATIDERNDPYLSSQKACRLLKMLYDQFGDWSLALAAYNAGDGTVRRALRKAGGDRKSHTFQTISKYLPAQTRAYLPKFIAMTYLMNFYDDHDVKIDAGKAFQPTDTIQVREKSKLSSFAGRLNVSLSELKKLNPHFRTDVIPATADRPCTLIVPAGKTGTATT